MLRDLPHPDLVAFAHDLVAAAHDREERIDGELRAAFRGGVDPPLVVVETDEAARLHQRPREHRIRQDNALPDHVEKGFWGSDAVQATGDVVSGVYGAVRKVPWEIYAGARDTLHSGLSATTQISDWAVGGIGYSHGVYVVDFKSGMYKGYDESVKAGNTAEAWGRAVGGALTFNLSEAGITLNDWAHGRATAEQFGESLGGVALSAAGLGAVGVAEQFYQRRWALGTFDAALTALPFASKRGRGAILENARTEWTMARDSLHGRMQPFVSRAIHGGVGNVAGAKTYQRAINWAELNGWRACFAAGTPIRTPFGSQRIESIRVGDLVLSRDEHNPSGLVVAQRVEEVFVRSAAIWHVHVGGQVIRTTSEHPFYREGDGWVACHDLRIGDRLLTEDGTWVAVEDMLDTGEWETVYNLRVADFHTYFVGCDEWGFSVWAHNACHRIVKIEGTQAWTIVDEAGQVIPQAAGKKFGNPANARKFADEHGITAVVHDIKPIQKFSIPDAPPGVSAGGGAKITNIDERLSNYHSTS